MPMPPAPQTPRVIVLTLDMVPVAEADRGTIEDANTIVAQLTALISTAEFHGAAGEAYNVAVTGVQL